jgi:outer membrane receptor protein involved in Fe transport
LNNVSPVITNNDLDNYFSLDRFDIGIRNIGGELRSNIDFFYGRPDPPSNHTLGFSNISAGYVMLDYALFAALRLSGGLRVEFSDLLTDARDYYDRKLPFNDKNRVGPGDNFIINQGVLRSLDFLPSLNIIYKVKKDEVRPINLRVNYSKTLARPSLREYSETIVYDFELNSPVLGNSQLKIVKVDNFDLRLESYFSSANSLSVSLFYKKFKNHIELSEGISWTNSLSSHVAGIEFETKCRILKGLDFKLNLALINSSAEVVFNRLSIFNFVRAWTPIDTVTRAMYGQAPYVVNGILNYNLEKVGMNLTVSYNLQGPRLVLSSLGGPPDIYEMPRHLVDLKVSKSVGSHFGISISIRDLLNSAIRRSYKFDDGFLLDFDKYNFGTSYNLGLSYKF